MFPLLVAQGIPEDAPSDPALAADREAQPPPSVFHQRGRISPTLPPDAPHRHRFVRGLVRLGQGLHHHDALRAAPAMAFHFFLSLLPLIVFVGYVAGFLARRRGVSAVMAPLIDNVPAGTEALIKSQLGRLAGARATTLGPVAAVGFLWIASGGVHGLMNAVEQVIGSRRRAWWRQRLLALAWVIGTLAVAGGASWAIIAWDDMVHAGDERHASASAENDEGALAGDEASADGAVHHDQEHVSPRAPISKKRGRSKVHHNGGERALALGLSLAGAVAGLATFYRFSVTHSSRVKRRVLPGAALAVLLWIVVTWAFSLYVRTLASYAVFYGSLAAVAVLLMWLWLVSLAILVGAELNSQLEGLRG